MNIYQSDPEMYQYTHLPGFAKFLLDQHLDDYVQDQLDLSKEMSPPILKYLSRMSEDELRRYVRQSSQEYLQYLAENKAKEQIEQSLQRWLSNELQIISKFEISSQDVTVINYLRLKVLKKWMRAYTTDSETSFALADELDNLFFGAITSGTDVLIEILKDSIISESHFNARLISTSPGIIFIFDIQNQKEIYVNGNVKQIMGYSAEEVMAMEENILQILTHPEDMPLVMDAIKTVLADAEGKTHHVEYRFKHKDGTYRWLRSYHTVFKRDHQGTPTELLGTTFEVTHEREIAEELMTREYQLLEAQALAKIGSYHWDLVEDKLINTPELANILELTPGSGREEFMNRLHPDDKQKVEAAMERALVTGSYDCEYRFIGEHGEKLLWGRGVIDFKDGKPIAMRGTVQDITLRKKIESELLIKTRELERSNESLQQFASVASHDLREPLRKMSMYSDMVLLQEEKVLSETSLANLAKVKSSAIRMQKMIEDILTFSSINTALKKSPTKLTEVVNEVMTILEDTIQDKNAVITYDDLPEMLVNPSQMRQLFQNLIANAIKFSTPGAPPGIEITHRFIDGKSIHDPDLQKAKRYLILEVKDNGIGFKQEYAEKIFGLFTRLHPQATYEGTGLGLSICKRVVENHGGIIRAISEPGKGSTFTITLPDLMTRNF